jgi:tetratricopeptide (TPR) repeat protein
MDLAAARRYFIAHSSLDKPFALELHDALQGDAWVDLYEISTGQIVLEQIAEGIEGASDFVLLWSANSVQSKWMRFEFHMAFIRHLEDDAIAIRILCLDDTPLPLYLRPFLQGKNVKSAEGAALLLGPAPRIPAVRTFVNRNDAIDAVERAFHSSAIGHVWFWGLAGVGKRTMVREALSRIVPDKTRVRVVDLRAGTGFVELDLLVTSLLGAEPPGSDLTESEAEQRAASAICEYAESGGIWVFHDTQHWLDDEARSGSVLRAVLSALERALTSSPGRLAIFTTTRLPQLDGSSARLGSVNHVRGLDEAYAIALLRAHGAESSETELRDAAREVDGHPLTLELAVTALKQGDIDWEDVRIQAAAPILGELRLSHVSEALLERVAAVDGPLAAEDYASHLAIAHDELQEAVAESVSYGVIAESDSGYLQLHPLVRDYYMRSFRRRPGFQEQAGELAGRAVEVLETTPPGTVVYVEALVSAFRLLGWAGRFDDAIALRRNLYGTLLETAIELYHQRRYPEAKRYFEVVIESTSESTQAELYLARTLANLGEIEEARALVDGVLRDRPRDHTAWRVRGRVEYIAHAFRSALAFYERALELRPGMPSVLRDIGQARMRIGDWHGARVALEEAVRRARDPDRWILFQYCQVLEHFRDYEAALLVMEDAIRRDPQNAGFHHRRGRIAEALGNEQLAIKEYEISVKLDPDLHESFISLASIAADRGQLDKAHAYLEQAARHHAPRRVLSNVRAKIALAQNDFNLARREVSAALEDARDIPNLDLAARIELQAIANEAASCEDAADEVKLYAEEIRLEGAADEAARLLEALQAVCPQ